MKRTNLDFASILDEIYGKEMAYMERLLKRRLLKNEHRPKLMEATTTYAIEKRKNPRQYCAKVHDRMNWHILGAYSKEIKRKWGLTRDHLIRDFFRASDLSLFSCIHIVALNFIQQGHEPLDAIDLACKMCLPCDHEPALPPKQENVYLEGKRLERRRKKSLERNGIQLKLDLFPEAS